MTNVRQLERDLQRLRVQHAGIGDLTEVAVVTAAGRLVVRAIECGVDPRTGTKQLVLDTRETA